MRVAGVMIDCFSTARVFVFVQYIEASSFSVAADTVLFARWISPQAQAYMKLLASHRIVHLHCKYIDFQIMNPPMRC